MNQLREPLSEEQMALLRVIYAPFDASADWPFWQYVDLTLEAMGVDATATLASLPVAGRPGPSSRSYGLVRHQDSFRQPGHDTPVALTVAGLRHLPEAEPILGAFFTTLLYLIEQQRKLIPRPQAVVEASVMAGDIEGQVLTALTAGTSAPPVEATLAKLRHLIAGEPPLYGTVSNHPSTWSVRVPARLRDYRDVATIEGYIDRVAEYVRPATASTARPGIDALDLPNAAGYLDAVWRNRTGSRLFASFDPASVARLTQPCASEGDFNTLMSALADVLAQVTEPGKTRPPQGGALEEVRKYLEAALDPGAATRTSEAISQLIMLRRIRVGAQHSDARARAVTAFGVIGLPFPPPTWEYAWAHVAMLAKAALDAIREEVHAGITQP